MVESLDNFQTDAGKTPGLMLEGWMLNMNEVSLSARVLYGLLLELSRLRGHAWPSQAFLSKRLGVSLRTITSLVGELRKAGLLDVEKPTPNRSTCLYRPKVKEAPPKRLAEPAPRTRKGVRKGVRSGGTQDLRTETNNELVLDNTPPLTPLRGKSAVGATAVDFRLEEFENCWTIWPLKQGRKTALRSWKRLAKTGKLPEPGKIQAVITAFRTEDDYWKRGKAPQFSKWLRGHRWDDQPHISNFTSPSCQPASPGHVSPSGPEMQARAQLALLRTTVSSGVVDPAMDALTRKIMDGHGGLHGLRTLPQREVGFALNGFVKAYLGLLNLEGRKTPSGMAPKENGPRKAPIQDAPPTAGPRTITRRLLEAVNLLAARYPANRTDIFEACRALDAEGRLPDPDELKRLSHNLNEPPNTWLRREFGKNVEERA